jgi:hypothetical protein
LDTCYSPEILENMRIRALHFAFLLVCLGTSLFGNSHVRAQNDGPEVTGCKPGSGSINSLLELQGYRLSPADTDKIKVYFLQNGKKYPANTRGGSSTSNDERHGPQSLYVIVPEGLVLGPSQIVVESHGPSSAPITVSIVEYKLPKVTRVTPTSGAQGTVVHISATGFHSSDELELTDAQGKPIILEAGADASDGTAFVVPKGAAEGVITVRIGNPKYGNNQYTEPFHFTVTKAAVPLELSIGDMVSVAPGQWLGLQASSLEPLKHSELTEVSFKQDGRTFVVATTRPGRPHVGVPKTLLPGEVQLQVRTWREGSPSVWSEPERFRLIARPVPPKVSALRLEKGSWVDLWPGPDRPKSFSANPGSVIVISGSFPVADVSRLSFTLFGPSGSVPLAASEFDEKAEWFGELRVKLPLELEKGDWRMKVAVVDDGTESELPINIHID